MGDVLQPMVALMAFLLGFEGVRIGSRPPEEAILATLAAYHLLGSLAALIGAAWRRRQESRGARARDLSSLFELWLFLALALWSGWPEWLRERFEGIPFVPLLVGLLPFVLQQALRTFLLAGQRKSRGLGSRREAVAFQLRVLGLFLIPLLCLNGLREVMTAVPALGLIAEAWPRLFQLVALCVSLFLVFSLSPLLVRFVVRAKPLPPGPLRDRLLAHAARTGFRPSEILVWRTGRAISNALYIGIWPKLRYIVLTDGLIARMDEDSLEAVYAHEAGHGMRKHLAWNGILVLVFALISSAMAIEVPWLIDRWFEAAVDRELRGDLGEIAVACLSLALVVAFFLVGVGWLSRRFETEADWVAVKTARSPADFPRALTEVGLQHGVLGKRHGFRHFAIGKRLGLVNRLLNEPQFRRDFERLMRRCRFGLIALLVGGLGLTAVQLPGELALGAARSAQIEGERHEREGDRQSAMRSLESAFHAFLRARSDPRAARVAEESAIWAAIEAADLSLAEGQWSFALRCLDQLQVLPEAAIAADEIHLFNTSFLRAQVEAVTRSNVSPETVKDLSARLDRLLVRFPQADADFQVRQDMALLRRIVLGRFDLEDPARADVPLAAQSPLIALIADLDAKKPIAPALGEAAKAITTKHRWRADVLERLHPGSL